MSIKTSIVRLETKHKKSQASCTEQQESGAFWREWLQSFLDEPKTAEQIKYEELRDKVKAILNMPEPDANEEPEKWLQSVAVLINTVGEFVKIIEEGVLSCEGLAERLASIRDNQENSNAPVTEEEIIRLKEITAQDRKSFDARLVRGRLRVNEDMCGELGRD